VLGEEHPNTLAAPAFIFKGQDRDEEAMALMEDCALLNILYCDGVMALMDVLSSVC
jgi:hypothetical protein